VNADTSNALTDMFALIDQCVPDPKDKVAMAVAVGHLIAEVTRDLQASVLACFPEEMPK
jgi:hypothetical protein